MKNQEHIVPSEAWGRSLSRALLWPLGIYFLFGITLLSEGLGGMILALFAGVVGLVIHFIAYCVVGLPVYICFWRTWPRLWTWQIGLPVGGLFGGFTLGLLNLILNGHFSASEFRSAFIFGGAYGMVTAVAAITSRQKNTGLTPNLKNWNS